VQLVSKKLDEFVSIPSILVVSKVPQAAVNIFGLATLLRTLSSLMALGL